MAHLAETKSDPLERSKDPRISAVQGILGRGLISAQEAVVTINNIAEAAISPPPNQQEIARLSKVVTENLLNVLSKWGLTISAIERDQLVALLSTSGERKFHAFMQRALNGCTDWGYRDGDDVVRNISKWLMQQIISSNSEIVGLKNLNSLAGQKVAFLGNHISALDVHALQHCLFQGGYDEVAEHLTAVVGYKTFELPLLRHLSLAFGTLKVPRNATLHTCCV